MKKVRSANLRIPGPTPLPPEVLKILSSQMINHRGKGYEAIHSRVIENLKYFFQTKNDIFLITASGMGGLESAVVNFFSPGDKIVSFTCGEFGNRWADVARAFSAEVFQVRFPSGKSVDKDEIYRVLEQNPDAKGVLFTLNETATGVLNKVADFAPFVHKHKNKPLLLVDAISSLGAVDFPMDEVGVDVLVTASQKAWMAPPGFAMVAVSPKAWDRHFIAKVPRYYFDLSQFKKFAEKNQTPATPAVTTLYGLDIGLQLMRKEGREKIFRRHLAFRDYVRQEIKKMGLELFVSEDDASPTVTSIKVPAGVDNHEWLKILREKYGLVMAGGMGDVKEKIVRIAHMGYVNKEDLDEALKAIKNSLKDIK